MAFIAILAILIGVLALSVKGANKFCDWFERKFDQ